MAHLDETSERFAEEEEVPAPTFDKRWALGFKDRGMGRGDFAVIEELPEGNCPDHGTPPTLIVECSSRELAEIIIQAHNQHLAMGKALKDSIVAIDDWLHRYAPEFCHTWHNEETAKRIAQAGGTIAYIADVQLQNREALGIKLGKLTTQERAEQDARCDRECRCESTMSKEHADQEAARCAECCGSPDRCEKHDVKE